MNSLTYLTLIITYKCSSRCAHCCIGAGPKFSEWMSVEDAEHYISVVTENNKIKWMTLIGGEALLDVDRTIEIGKVARAYGIEKVEINSNASWCTCDEVAEEVFQRIKDADLTISGPSVDAFHQKYVNKESVLRFIQIGRKFGFELNGFAEFIEKDNPDNPFDVETNNLLNWLTKSGFNPGSDKVVFQGRGVNLQRYYTGERSIPKDPCEGVYYFGTKDFREPGGIQIDVNGHVMLDHGICIGNAKEQSLSEILNSFSAETHPIISVLMKEGPLGLTRIPEARGFKLKEGGYIDNCHLCQEIRTFLRPFFPDILCPDSYYPKII